MSLRTRVSPVGVKIEAVEGTPEVLTDADAMPGVNQPAYTMDVTSAERDAARDTFTPLPPIVTSVLAGVDFRMEAGGSGDLTIPPLWAIPLAACGFQEHTLGEATIGAVTGGPFKSGERITTPGGFSGMTLLSVADGTTEMLFLTLSGALSDADVITGTISGATATVSGAPATDQGFAYRPLTNAIPSVTVGRYLDGKLKSISGARGNVALEMVGGQLGYLAFSFQGQYQTWTDETPISVTTNPPTPPVFRGVQMLADGVEPPCFLTFNVDMANEIAARECAKLESLIAGVNINGRTPTGSIDPESVLPSEYNPAEVMVNGTQVPFQAQWGDTPGNTIVVSGPTAVISDLAEGDRNGNAISQRTLAFAGAGLASGDDEIIIAVI